MKTLLILVDGMRPDALANCKIAQEVMADSVYTLDAKTVMPSVTLPCHMSLFYSVEPGRHGTTTNVYTPQVRPISGLCDVFAKARKSVSFFYGWGELRDLCLPSSLSEKEREIVAAREQIVALTEERKNLEENASRFKVLISEGGRQSFLVFFFKKPFFIQLFL